MIQTTELLPGVTLRVFPADRFKQNSLTVQFVRPMSEAEASYNALLPAVLLRGCRSTPDLRAITLRLDDLYGASVGAVNRRVGDYHATGLSCRFISDQFALKGDRIMASAVEFLGELLLEPVLEAGAFRPDYVALEKSNLLNAIKAQKNDKRSWCVTQMLRQMCRADSFGISRLGEKEKVIRIQPQDLYDHYRKLLAESRIEVFYVGQDPEGQLPTLLRNMFRQIERRYVNLPPQTHFCSAGGGEYTETQKVIQGKLCMGFSSDIDLRGEGFAAMQVCNEIFGSGMTSKLFVQVREKRSLCYDIGSHFHGSKGIMVVSAGIDNDKDQLVKDQVLTQLEEVCHGRITDEELLAAKQALVSDLRGVHDSTGSIEGYYAIAALSGLRWTPAEYIAAIEQVDKAAVAAAARTLKLDTVYFLKGEQ